jgi:hypothetical protein
VACKEITDIRSAMVDIADTKHLLETASSFSPWSIVQLAGRTT